MIVHLRQSFTWSGRSVAWDRIGSGPPVILCHGTPWSSALWDPIAHALAVEYTVYLWDMPGYGQSSMDAEHAVDLGVQGEVFAALLEHWRRSDQQFTDPHVIAHDYGGAVTLRAHLLHGATYGSLALVDVVALRPWGSDFFRLVADNADVFAALPPAVHRGAIEAYIAGASHRGLRDDDLAMLVEPWCADEGQQAFYRQIAQADQRFTDEVQNRYATIDLPVHIIWGEADTWIPVARAHELCALIPNSSVETIVGAGHLVQLDAPAELTAALHRWLATQHQPAL